MGKKLYKFNSESLRFQPYNVKLMVFKLLLVYVIGIAIMVAALLVMLKPEKAKASEPHVMVVKAQTKEVPFSFNEFKQFVVDTGIKFPEIVIAQAIQESGFSSQIWIENNNPFGMKVARSRNTTAIDENRGHARYKNWRMAVVDYAYMQAVFARGIENKDDYFEYLKHYAENPEYESKLKAIIKQFKGFGLSEDYLLY